MYQFWVINYSSLKLFYSLGIYSYSDNFGGVFELGVMFLENKPICFCDDYSYYSCYYILD